MRSLIIVARDQRDLWQALTDQFTADRAVKVILDRWLEGQQQRVRMGNRIGGRDWSVAFR